MPFGGTSESAPLTAGVAALVIQAYRKTHGGATPSPGGGQADHHQHADDIGAPGRAAGTGLTRRLQGGLAAESYKGVGSRQRGERRRSWPLPIS